MRFALFGGLYLSTGMAIAQSGDYSQFACMIAIGATAVLMSIIGVMFGVFGGKI